MFPRRLFLQTATAASLAAAAPRKGRGVTARILRRAWSYSEMKVAFMIFMALAMYLLMFRPQQKKAREHAELLKTITNGDRIVTSGGILGVVVGIKDKSVSIRSADTKLEVLKSSIAEILERSSAAPQQAEA